MSIENWFNSKADQVRVSVVGPEIGSKICFELENE